MYKVSKNIKVLSFTLMIVGALGLAFSFYSAPKTIEQAKEMVVDSHHDDHSKAENSHSLSANDHVDEDGHSISHDEHLLHKLQNRPWSALYVAALFFMFLSLGTLAFYAIQRASQAGWSPLLFRVMEGITAYLLPGTLIILVVLILSSMHLNHLFVWMDPDVVAHDKIIQGKSGYLNSPFFNC